MPGRARPLRPVLLPLVALACCFSGGLRERCTAFAGALGRRSAAVAGWLAAAPAVATPLSAAAAAQPKKAKFDFESCKTRDTGGLAWALDEAETRPECLELAASIAERCGTATELALRDTRGGGGYNWCIGCEKNKAKGKPCEPRKQNFARYR
ncbi:unnamed protein product [Prorocentrum cordatum]|uniref:Uncharacterized protein n=1 Tax=Prorocentrum cordatum TaxID=2364126 RepID=A0ABN9V122_9DINO|nr:unnamed protein product [Polarella glacialis]